MMALGAALALETGCGKPSEGAPAGKGGGKAGRGALEFPVEVEAVEARDVEYVVSAVGSVEAFEQVQITARVAGVVERVRFMEGQSVKQGQVLAEIEPTRYGIAVRAAKAALERAEAVRLQAESAAQRRVAVNEVKPGLLPAEQLASAQAPARGAPRGRGAGAGHGGEPGPVARGAARRPRARGGGGGGGRGRGEGGGGRG